MEIRLHAAGTSARFQRQATADCLHIAQTFDLPTLPLIMVGGTPRGADGALVSCRDTKSATICIRRKPVCGSFRYILAHELAHYWQLLNDLPFDEQQADDMAFKVWGQVF